ncbi:Tellurite resistance protein TehA [Metschnikowia aff. pulcherrima]|uniref:Tellurite resistance protein TehA n=1 Tax=Metschnikowia aff. pulcherrima TaxID=2163413 RepID=A0A4P6XKF5_9ASCO|nr:Tellurite resistance protein TehA [Metschnikowia aff. pulcherrima]
MSEPCALSGDTLRPAGLPGPDLYTHDTSGGELTVLTKTADLTWLQRVKNDLRTRFIDGFTPVFFASVMGTGMSANLLYNFPYPAHWLQVCGIIMALVGLLIFIVLSTFFALALISRPGLFSKIHRDPALAPAMGCFVMGYTTLITFLHGVLGRRWIIGVWVLWWIVVFGSFYTSIVTFYFSLMAKHRRSKNIIEHASLSMQYLLPVVTLTVAASLGGIITADLPATRDKIATMVVTLVMWAIAMLLASIIVTINFWRIFVHKIPHSGQVLTMFLPIGFVGQGAYAILLFAQNSLELLLSHHSVVADSAYVSFLGQTALKNDVATTDLALIMSTAIMVVCALVAFMLMAFGFLLTVFAYMALFSKMAPFAKKRNHAFLYSTQSSLRLKRIFVGLMRFQRGFWLMTFPIGTMSLATHHFYSLYHGFSAFRVVATIYAMLVIITTLGCLVGVVYRGVTICTRAIDRGEKAGNEKVEATQESV